MTKNWREWSAREGVDLTTIVHIDECFYHPIWHFTKTKDELFFTTLENKTFTHYTAVDPTELARFFYKKYFPNNQRIMEYYHKGEKIISQNRQLTKKWQAKLSGTRNTNLLIKILKDFNKNYSFITHYYSIYPYFIIEAWQNDLESVVSRLISKNHLEGEKEKICNSLYQPLKQTAIVELQEKIQQGVSAKRLARDYQFLRSWSYIWYQPISENWIKDMAGKPKAKSDLYSTEEILKKLQPNKKERYFIKMASHMIFFKDYRDDLRRQVIYYWSFLFDKIAQFLKVSREDLGYLTIEEITQALSGKDFKKMIELRKNNICLVTVDTKKLKMKVINSPLPKKYQKIINQNNKKEKAQELKGLIAQTGVARGKVRIIKSYHDIEKFKAGEILVANTTHPNYLPAMKIASAFVTNEGGVICHAAIVAREMNKPCIVGTKIATKVLKDGNMIEVDANRGIVSRLSSK